MKISRRPDSIVIDARAFWAHTYPGWVFSLIWTAALFPLLIFRKMSWPGLNLFLITVGIGTMLAQWFVTRSFQFHRGSSQARILLRLGPFVFRRRTFDVIAIKVEEKRLISWNSGIEYSLFALRITSPIAESINIQTSRMLSAVDWMNAIASEISQYTQVVSSTLPTASAASEPNA